MRTVSFVTALLLVLLAGRAAAQTMDWEDTSNLPSRYGLAGFVGAGVGDFTDPQLRDVTGAAGLWEVRAAFGTRLPLSLEVSYQGGLQNIDALGLPGDARLLSTTVEGAIRVAFLPGNAQPYAFIGAGWSRFTLENVEHNTSDLEGGDNTFNIPMGVGLQLRYRQALLDLRGTFRAVTFENLAPSGEDSAEDMSSWAVALHAGFEL